MRVTVAITGASGAHLGIKALELMPKNIEKHLISTQHAEVALKLEQSITIHKNSNIGASIASGSFKVDAMLITPCSINTLSKIANGIADNLVTRAAAVIIKERKTLLLAPREIPFSPIALENMHKLSMMGVIIAPPTLAYYSNQNTLEEMERYMIGKWFDLVGIENRLYKRWGEVE